MLPASLLNERWPHGGKFQAAGLGGCGQDSCLILVVVGHPVGPAVYAKYIYWFHMPVFFLLSGYLFKPPDGWPSLRSWLSKRSRGLLVPYCAYLVLVTLVRYFYVYRYLHILEASFVLKDLPDVLFAGRAPGVYYTVFWFFTCSVRCPGPLCHHQSGV